MSSTKQFIVSEFMRKDVVTLAPNATVREAVKVMIQNQTNGLVIVNENNKVVGILSSWDIIRHVVPDYLEEDKHLASFESADIFLKRTKEIENDPIAKFMTKKVHTVKEESSLMEATTLLSEFHIRQLPVVNPQGVLIGYINRTDIKLAMGEIMGIHSPA